MERNKIVGMVLGVLLVVGLGAWLFGRDDGDVASNDDVVGESGPVLEQARNTKQPRDLTSEPKAAISGSVRTRDGKAIAGARVCAWPDYRDREGLPGTPRCTKTEADGHYRLDELLPIGVNVSAQARGFLPQDWSRQHETYRETRLQLRAGETSEGIDLVMREGGVEVNGVVRDISGGVIDGAFVWAQSDALSLQMSRTVAESDADGRFTLWTAPGRVSVHADADGYATGYRHGWAPGAMVDVVLTPESVISGRVVMAGTGEPVAGVVVGAASEDTGFSGGEARSDDGGNFRIDKLAPGIYTLGADADELHGEAVELVHLGLAEVAEDLVIELHPAFMVTGQVVIAGGAQPRSCPQGWVELTDRADPRNKKYGPARDGEFEISAIVPGTYQVDVSCEGMVPEPKYPDIEIVDGGASGLVWEVREGLAIRGEVRDGQGVPVETVRVRASMKADADNPRQQTTGGFSEPTLDDGQFVMDGLLPGTYEVSVFGLDGGPSSDPITVVLSSGADVNDVRLQIKGTGTVTGMVRDADGQPVAGIGVSASGEGYGWGTGQGTSDDEGRFVLEYLPPGEARIVATDQGNKLRAPGTGDDDRQGILAQVREGETTEVEIVIESRKATIRGRVLDEHGSPVPDAFVSQQRASDSATAGKGRGKSRLRWSFDDRSVLTSEDGTFVVDGLAEDGNYTVGAFRKGGGEALLEGVRPGDSVELTIVDTGEIAGKVVAGESAPDRFTVTVSNEAEGLSRRDELYRSAGVFRMKELPPGTYVLLVDSPLGTARVEGIELGPGEAKTDLVVKLSPRVTVRGRVIDIDTRAPIPGISVTISARSANTYLGDADDAQISDADGRFEVANALTGKVSIVVTPRDRGEDSRYRGALMTRQIPASEGVVDIGDIELVSLRVGAKDKPGDTGFEVKRPDLGADPEAYVPTVALIRPGGPAAASGLAIGDTIETVDGHDVRGNNSFRFARLTTVPPGQSFKLGLAGGRTVTITAGPPRK